MYWWEWPPDHDNIYRGREATPTKHYSRLICYDHTDQFQNKKRGTAIWPVPRRCRYKILFALVFDQVMQDRSQDEFHRKAHFAAGDYQGIGARHKGTLNHGEVVVKINESVR